MLLNNRSSVGEAMIDSMAVLLIDFLVYYLGGLLVSYFTWKTARERNLISKTILGPLDMVFAAFVWPINLIILFIILTADFCLGEGNWECFVRGEVELEDYCFDEDNEDEVW